MSLDHATRTADAPDDVRDVRDVREAPDATDAPDTTAVTAAPADAVAATDAPEAADAPAGTNAGAETDADATPDITFGDLGLHDSVVRKLTANGVVTPFPIQAATIPDALSGRDILGRGRTGSGKTLSFGLPLLTRLSGGRTERKRPRGVILTPTRELAMQVADALQPYGDVLGLKMKVVCGGTSMQNQIYALERGVDVLVATPGRLRDLINRGAAALDDVAIAVLDEADQMADMGFLPEVTELLDLIPAGGQRLLFSATLENEVDTLVKRYLVDPVTHEVDAAQGAVTTMSHHVLVVKPKDKAPVTAAIAARKGRTIIFVRTQMGADRVAEQLVEAGVRADALHGGMTQGARTRTLDDFKSGYVNVLVATDVAARGIHVDDIDLVLNVDPAGDHKDYLHRSGRTARAGRSGTVVSLALPHQRRQTFRLMEDAGVDASRHIIGGAGVFDEEVARITGARSLTDVQADSVRGAAVQAEREVAELTRRLEQVQRRATELREEADRLTARSARERGEDPDEAVAAKAAELAEQVAAEAAAAAAAAVPEPRQERQERQGSSYQRREERGGYERRDDRRDHRSDDRRDHRGGDERRDERGNFERRRDDRPSSDRPSYDRRDSRPSYGRDRDDRRPAYGRDRDDRRPSYGARDDRPWSRDRRDSSRPSYGRDRDDRRPAYGRDRDDRRPSYGARDDRPWSRDRRDSSRPSYSRDRDDRRPAYGRDRDDRRPSYGARDDRAWTPDPRDSSRPSYSRDRDDRRPAYGRDRDDRRPSYGARDDRPWSRDRRDSSRPSYGDRDRRPSYGDRDRDRPTTHSRDNGPAPYGERKPRWKRNG